MTRVAELEAEVEHLRYLLAEMTSPPPAWVVPMVGYRLTRQQAALMSMLLRAEGKVVLRQALRSGIEFAASKALDGPEEKTVDVQVCRLRKRLKDVGSPLRIRSVVGVGYMLEGAP